MAVAAKTKKKAKKRSSSQMAVAVRQFKRNKLAMVGLAVFVIMILACLFADFLTPYDYATQDIANRCAPLSWEHPMGTDNYGRDLLTRLLKGGQISLLVGALSVALAACAGALLGCTASYFGGIYETIVMRCVDIFMSIPALLLATAVATALGTGVVNSVIAIAIASLATITRMMHSASLSARHQEYIEAARANGASRLRCIIKYVLPNCMGTWITVAALRFSSAITQVASLSFLGLGVTPPTPEWGSILNAGRTYIRSYAPLIVFPGLFIAITIASINFVGDGLRDAFDPRLKR